MRRRQRHLARNVTLLMRISEDLQNRVDKPQPDSFYSRAFNANRRTATAVTKTAYLQDMAQGTLDPLDYGCLTVQDAYYCYCAGHAADAP